MIYKLYILKRTIEDIFIFPFILIGKLIAVLKPLPQEYKVFFFFPFYHTGGAEKVHAQVATATGGNNCIVFFTRKSEDDSFLQDFIRSGCQIRVIANFTDNKWLYFLNLIWRGIVTHYINRQQIKPVVFNGQCNFGYKISPWISKGIPQVELIHSPFSFSYIRIPFLPFIRKTVMISRQTIEFHKDMYRRYKIPEQFLSKIVYIPNAISLPARIGSKPPGNFKVLYTGRATREKRVELIASIAREIRKVDESIQFEMLGDVSKVIKAAEYPYIKFHGTIKDDDTINRIYSESHVLILVSTNEGFPMVIMEAMANGCAILATPVGDIPLHVRDGENGFLLTSVTDEALIIAQAVEKIIALKNNPDQLKKIISANIHYAHHNFGIERLSEDYRNLLKSL